MSENKKIQGFTKLSNQLLNNLLDELDPIETKVFLYIITKTLGFQKASESISASNVSEKTNICKKTVRDTFKSLQQKNYITVTKQFKNNVPLASLIEINLEKTKINLKNKEINLDPKSAKKIKHKEECGFVSDFQPLDDLKDDSAQKLMFIIIAHAIDQQNFTISRLDKKGFVVSDYDITTKDIYNYKDITKLTQKNWINYHFVKLNDEQSDLIININKNVLKQNQLNIFTCMGHIKFNIPSINLMLLFYAQLWVHFEEINTPLVIGEVIYFEKLLKNNTEKTIQNAITYHHLTWWHGKVLSVQFFEKHFNRILASVLEIVEC